MTSKRELIVQNIVDTLDSTAKDMTTRITIKKVTREPVIVEDMAMTAIPLAFVQSANEVRDYGAMGGEFDAELEIVLHLYVMSSTRDSDRNLLLNIIESSLLEDVTRGGAAIDTRITEIDLVEFGEAAPFASLEVTVTVDYCYAGGALL